ncbi:hypothetical protein BGY98DRAFT_85987 [Russula aff. rugulosa BPL654]|nr:hypothetical protein BGY98DRAFT_85987 [Russula aff. rugulosa BPL654]
MASECITAGGIFNSSSDTEKSLGVAMPPLIDLIHEHPNATPFDTAQRLVQTHARRLRLLDDEETGHQVVVCPHAISSHNHQCNDTVLYPVVAFLISSQCTRDIQSVHRPLCKLGIGTYDLSMGKP